MNGEVKAGDRFQHLEFLKRGGSTRILKVEAVGPVKGGRFKHGVIYARCFVEGWVTNVQTIAVPRLLNPRLFTRVAQ